MAPHFPFLFFFKLCSGLMMVFFRLKNGTPVDESLIGVKYFPTKDTSRFSLRLRNIDPSDEGVYTIRLERGGKILQSDGKLIVKKLPPLEDEEEATKKKTETGISETRKERVKGDLPDEVASFDSPPFFHYKLEDETVNLGDRMVLSVTNTTLPEPEVEWYKNGDRVLEDSKYAKRKDKGRYELIIAACEMDDEADWLAVGINKYGQCESRCHLTVLNPDKAEKPEFRHPLDNEIVYEKSQLKLEVTVVSKLPVKVIWFKDDEKVAHSGEYRLVESDNHYSLSILDCKRAHSGEYTCEASNAAGKASTRCKVTVKTGKPRGPDEEETQAPSIRMPLPATRELPENTEVKLVCAVTGIPTPEITWFKDDREVNFAELSYDNGLAQLLIPKAKTTHSGVYTVMAKNEHGSVRSVGMLYIERKCTHSRILKTKTKLI